MRLGYESPDTNTAVKEYRQARNDVPETSGGPQIWRMPRPTTRKNVRLASHHPTTGTKQEVNNLIKEAI